MRFDLITIFPEFFRGPFNHGIIRRAVESGLLELNVVDLRTYTHDRHKTVDDRPFGGGEGMVLKPEPLFEATEALGVSERSLRVSAAARQTARESVVLLSAAGRSFDQSLAEEMAQLERVVLICGRYEGVDERVAEHLADREVSVGDFVLSGGELGAAMMVDVITRLLPGALGNAESSRQESFSSARGRTSAPKETIEPPSSTCVSGGLLDYPHYTRPAEFRGLAVPEVLAGGNHDEIRLWRRRRALEKTLRNRPDLLERAELEAEDRKLLAEIRAKNAPGKVQ